MNLADLDIKTIISLVFVGNLVELVILVFYRNIPEYRRPYWHFLAAKLLQSLGWLLLSLRGGIPDLISAYVGNTMLLSGFALEVFALTTVGRQEKKWGSVYLAIAAAGIAAFWILARTPNLWVGYATSTSIALFLPASLSMISDKSSSHMRKLIGLFYVIICVPLAFRAWYGFFAGSDFILMSRNLIQTFSFVALFMLMIVSGIGFLLLFKEQADEIISESEKKYRLLVEKANEAICIVQGGKVVFANRKTGELLGLPSDEILGRPFTDFIFHEDLEKVVSNYTGRTEQKNVPDTYNFRVVDKAGEPIWGMISATIIEYNGGPATLALITNINSIKLMEQERERIIGELQKAVAEVKTLSGLLPICSSCKKIRDDRGYWNQIEVYIKEHSSVDFSHGICPECCRKLYPDLFND